MESSGHQTPHVRQHNVRVVVLVGHVACKRCGCALQPGAMGAGCTVALGLEHMLSAGGMGPMHFGPPMRNLVQWTRLLARLCAIPCDEADELGHELGRPNCDVVVTQLRGIA